MSTVFASRWKALMWSAGVLLTAYCTVPSPEEPEGTSGKHNLATGDAPSFASDENLRKLQELRRKLPYASLYVHPMACAYCSSKAVLPALSRGASVEFASSNVRGNSIYPGIISSEMAERDFERKGNKEAFLAAVPMRRMGEASEIATLALFFLSDRARAITGADFVADGGKTIL